MQISQGSPLVASRSFKKHESFWAVASISREFRLACFHKEFHLMEILQGSPLWKIASEQLA